MGECNAALSNMVKVGGRVASMSHDPLSASSASKRSRNGASREQGAAESNDDDEYDGMILEPDVSIGEREDAEEESGGDEVKEEQLEIEVEENPLEEEEEAEEEKEEEEAAAVTPEKKLKRRK